MCCTAVYGRGKEPWQRHHSLDHYGRPDRAGDLLVQAVVFRQRDDDVTARTTLQLRLIRRCRRTSALSEQLAWRLFRRGKSSIADSIHKQLSGRPHWWRRERVRYPPHSSLSRRRTQVNALVSREIPFGFAQGRPSLRQKNSSVRDDSVCQGRSKLTLRQPR